MKGHVTLQDWSEDSSEE